MFADVADLGHRRLPGLQSDGPPRIGIRAEPSAFIQIETGV